MRIIKVVSIFAGINNLYNFAIEAVLRTRQNQLHIDILFHKASQPRFFKKRFAVQKIVRTRIRCGNFADPRFSFQLGSFANLKSDKFFRIEQYRQRIQFSTKTFQDYTLVLNV